MSEEDGDSGRRTLQSILSLLISRSEIIGRYDDDSDDNDDSDSDSDDSNNDQANASKKQDDEPNAQNLKRVRESDFALLTRRDLQDFSPIDNNDIDSKGSSDSKGETAKKGRMGSENIAGSSSSKMENIGVQSGIPRRLQLPERLFRRELGPVPLGRKRCFDFGDRCRIFESFLPNHKVTLARFRQKVFCGSFSNQGDLFMSACHDQRIRIYDTQRGKFDLKQTIRARNVGWSVLDTALSPDGQHLIYSSWSDFIHQVNLYEDEDSSERHRALALNTGDRQFCLFSIRFSSDGFEILGGSNDGFIYLYDRFTQSQSLKINAHDDDVNAVCFVDDRTHILASGGDDGLCKVWDRRALRESNPVPVGTFAGHTDGLTFIDPRGDGRHLITNSKDQSIKLWDLRKFSCGTAVAATLESVRAQHWDYRWQGVPKKLNAREHRKDDVAVMTYTGHKVLQTLIRCHFSPMHSTGQKFIYTGGGTTKRGDVIVYNALDGSIVCSLHGHQGCVRDVAWSPNAQEIISSSWDFTIAKWVFKEDLGEENLDESEDTDDELSALIRNRKELLRRAQWYQ